MDEFLHSPPLAARFPGACTDCGGDIDAGDTIVLSGGDVSHVECFDHGDCPENSTCE
jgi:hypothetical protein